MQAAAGSPAGKHAEVAWFLRPPLAHQSSGGGGGGGGAVPLPLPLPCPYLMSAHHNRYLLSQNQVIILYTFILHSTIYFH
jgi:hypothetical protein